MQPFETWLKADLQAPVTVKRIDGNLFSGDNQGNLVGVTVTDAGEPATLSGEVRGYFIRSDGNTVIMSGTIDGNKVTVVLPSACYTVVGQFSLVIKVGQVAVGACTGYVYQSNTDSTVDPEHVIPDIDQLLTRVEALEGRATTLEGDVSAQNNTINAIEDGLAIIATGNVHPAIANGQFVYVKGHSSLAEGLYRATAAIGTNATLSTSNLTADGSGGLNALKGDLDSLNSNINTTYRDIYGNGSINNCNNAEIGKWYHVYPSASNIPMQATGILFTYGNDDERHQICESGSRFFVRRYTTGSAWTNWEELSLKSNLSPVVIYPMTILGSASSIELSEAIISYNKLYVIISPDGNASRKGILTIPVPDVVTGGYNNTNQYIVSVEEYSGNTWYTAFIQFYFSDNRHIAITGSGVNGWTNRLSVKILASA